MIKWSLIFGVLGVIVTGVMIPYLSKRVSPWGPLQQWFVGIAALFPAWLIAFVGLLPSSTVNSDQVPLPPVAIISSSAALFGIVLTHYAVRRLHRSGPALHPIAYWLLGLAAIIPGWCVALFNILDN